MSNISQVTYCNLGNTCYVSSMLQLLRASPTIMTFMYKHECQSGKLLFFCKIVNCLKDPYHFPQNWDNAPSQSLLTFRIDSFIKGHNSQVQDCYFKFPNMQGRISSLYDSFLFFFPYRSISKCSGECKCLV